MKIVFCHNVYNRFKTLRFTIDAEKTIFPDSQSIVGYNVESPIEAGWLNGLNNVEVFKFPGVTHKIGCTNGCIETIKAAIKYNPDVIVFSHDDVHLNSDPQYVQIFIENAKLIASGKYDAICRKPLPVETYGKEYYLMETFSLSKKGAQIAFGNLQPYANEDTIPRDARGSISPEVFLYKRLQNKNLNILEMGYEHKLENYNTTLSETMGFIHKNAGDRAWTD